MGAPLACRELHKPDSRTPSEAAYLRVMAALSPQDRPRNDYERGLVRRTIAVMQDAEPVVHKAEHQEQIERTVEATLARLERI